MSNNLLLQEIAIGLWAVHVHVLKKVIWNYLKITFPFIIELNKKKTCENLSAVMMKIISPFAVSTRGFPMMD